MPLVEAIVVMKNGGKYWLLIPLALWVVLLVACGIPLDEFKPDWVPTVDLSYLINSNPAEVDNSDLPITPTDEIHVTGTPQNVDIAEYRLTVDGLVETPLALTYEDILSYPTITEVLLLICPGTFADNAEWTGVPVSTLLAGAGLKPEASEVAFHALDGYRVVLPLENVQRDGVFLAHTVNGEVLPKIHGYPVRLVLRGIYGGDWVKWVTRLQIK